MTDRTPAGLENYSNVRQAEADRQAAAMAADPVAETARRRKVEDDFIRTHQVRRLERLGWSFSATHLYDEDAVEGWSWTDGSREITETGAHDQPPEIPDELLALIAEKPVNGANPQ